MRGRPGELKHLSTLRKRKKIFDFLSSGERTGKSPNQIYLGLRTQQRNGEFIVEDSWEATQYKVIAL